MKTDGAGGRYFAFTDPVRGTPHGMKIPYPVNLMVRGFAHTHPPRYVTQEFSYDDKVSYEELKAKGRETPFYLRTPFGNIVKAAESAHFMHGKDVLESSCRD
jgi:hypothetical protein